MSSINKSKESPIYTKYLVWQYSIFHMYVLHTIHFALLAGTTLNSALFLH